MWSPGWWRANGETALRRVGFLFCKGVMQKRYSYENTYISNTLNKGGIMKKQVFGILIALVLVLSFGFTVPALSCPFSVFVDVKPMSCPNPLNVRSKGVLPVAILGAEDFDVTTVDPASVRLNLADMGLIDGEGVCPLRWAYEDVATPYLPDIGGCHDLGPDGYLDLVLKFRTQEVVALDLSGHEDGAEVDLQITGQLFDGFYIIGQDTIVVINKMINGDG
jgi:hypothetical protein